MMQHLHREIEYLKKEIIRESGLVETNLRESVKALMTRDLELAQEIAARDHIIDALEVEVEEECLKIFALYQPVAVDLRYLVAFLKLNNDLERIGDLATNIAERAVSLAVKDRLDIPAEIPRMSELVQKMLKDTLDALVDLDSKKAKSVIREDDSVDSLHHSMYQIVGDKIQADPEHVGNWLEILAVSRYLERIADHCTNIAEDVEYMLSGRIQRHISTH
ncbi:MAG: phosphate signaling complex protein PhoU [Candidatus Marinimicrobia bacterium]|nr:phosphate signaling complex protein PhoU [Candidatus Neomarinimicrobiota bacterium]